MNNPPNEGILNVDDADVGFKHRARGFQTGCNVKKKMLQVLLVDDEPVVAKVLAYMVKISGCKCTLQLGSLEASRLIAEQPSHFDLLITDYVMPDMNGLQLLQKARSAGYSGKAILISGQMADGPFNPELVENFDDILRKPFSLEELQASIKKVASMIKTAKQR